MSLEATIQENTNAIRDLIAALSKGVPATAAQVAAVVTEANPRKAQDDVASNVASSTPAPSLPSAEAAAQKTAPAAVVPAAGAASDTEKKPKDAAPAKTDAGVSNTSDAPTYQDAAAAITKLSRAKGRDAAVAVLKQFKAAKLPDVEPAQFAALIAAADEAATEEAGT